jgi:methyl-accepting chemotaxis protein
MKETTELLADIQALVCDTDRASLPAMKERRGGGRLKAGGKFSKKVVDVVNAAHDMNQAIDTAVGTLRGAMRNLKKASAQVGTAHEAMHELSSKIAEIEQAAEQAKSMIHTMVDPHAIGG